MGLDPRWRILTRRGISPTDPLPDPEGNGIPGHQLPSMTGGEKQMRKVGPEVPRPPQEFSNYTNWT